MDRKDFLITLWSKLFKPILLLGVIIFCIRFLIRIFTNDDTERLMAVLVLGFIILSSLSYLISIVSNKVIQGIKSRLSGKSLLTLRIFGKILDYLFPIALGILIYHLWIKDWIFVSAFFGVILISKIIEIVKREKTGYNNGYSK